MECKGNTFEVNEDALASILKKPLVQGCKVMVVSVIGGIGSGNSFLLNVFLKYLKNRGKPDWMDDPNDPVDGFPWGCSPNGNTKGIRMWGEPFYINTYWHKICVLLMDVQGLNHNFWKSAESQKILALTSFLTSYPVFNTNKGNDFLEELKCFISYEQKALEVYQEMKSKKFVFLIQDLDAHSYGLKDFRYIIKELELKSEKKDYNFEDLQDMSEMVYRYSSCFNMPNPGKHVLSKNFHGRLSDEGINPEFKSSLKKLTEFIFDPKRLPFNTIHGEYVNGRVLFHCFKSFCKVFQGENLPEQRTLMEASLKAIDMTHEDEIEEFCGKDPNKDMKMSILKTVQQHERELKAKKEAGIDVAMDEAINMYKHCMGQAYDVRKQDLKSGWLKFYHFRSYDYAYQLLKSLGYHYLEWRLRGKLLELYDTYKKDSECFEAYIKSLPLTNSENKKDQ